VEVACDASAFFEQGEACFVFPALGEGEGDAGLAGEVGGHFHVAGGEPLTSDRAGDGENTVYPPRFGQRDRHRRPEFGPGIRGRVGQRVVVGEHGLPALHRATGEGAFGGEDETVYLAGGRSATGAYDERARAALQHDGDEVGVGEVDDAVGDESERLRC